MSLEKLPPVSFKNKLEKQQIAQRMYNHRRRLLELDLKKSRHGHSEVNIDPFKTLHEDNPKRNYFLENKYTEIERENRILFEKITKISKHKRRSGEGIDRIKSLNITFRKQKIEEI